MCLHDRLCHMIHIFFLFLGNVFICLCKITTSFNIMQNNYVIPTKKKLISFSNFFPEHVIHKLLCAHNIISFCVKFGLSLCKNCYDMTLKWKQFEVKLLSNFERISTESWNNAKWGKNFIHQLYFLKEKLPS